MNFFSHFCLFFNFLSLRPLILNNSRFLFFVFNNLNDGFGIVNFFGNLCFEFRRNIKLVFLLEGRFLFNRIRAHFMPTNFLILRRQYLFFIFKLIDRIVFDFLLSNLGCVFINVSIVVNHFWLQNKRRIQKFALLLFHSCPVPSSIDSCWIHRILRFLILRNLGSFWNNVCGYRTRFWGSRFVLLHNLVLLYDWYLWNQSCFSFRFYSVCVWFFLNFCSFLRLNPRLLHFRIKFARCNTTFHLTFHFLCLSLWRSRFFLQINFIKSNIEKLGWSWFFCCRF